MAAKSPGGALHYLRVPEDWRKGAKLDFLRDEDLRSISWGGITPNDKSDWMRTENEDEFESFLLTGSKQAKRAISGAEPTLFRWYSGGVKTNRDWVVYDFDRRKLIKRIEQFSEAYNIEVFRYSRVNPPPSIDDFVDYGRIKWSEGLKSRLRRIQYAEIDTSLTMSSMYRPFVTRQLYFDKHFVERAYQQHRFFPNADSSNRLICVSGVASDKPFQVLAVDTVPCLDMLEKTQCFPFYAYDRDGSNRRENITDFALTRFREQYADPRINKWDIFHYVYALLHHPGYRARYALDLKRSLPRIPYVPSPRLDGGTEGGHASPRLDGGTEGGQGGFHTFAKAGRQLADLHLHYERAEPYPLEWDTGGKTIDFRVERMRPGRKRAADDGDWKVFDSLKYNDTLTLRGIPERAFAYRLGNRSALEWVVDQWRVKHDKRSGITHDANDYSDDEQYVVRLVERVVGVSLGTMDVVDGLAGLGFR